MLENKFILLFINLLWMSGLFGAIFSLIYLGRYRQRHWWHLGATYSVPRTLTPLHGTIALFCLGLALHAYATQQTVSLWVALIWAQLALLFGVRLFTVALAGFQDGWDTPLQSALAPADQQGGTLLWSGLVAVLLIINLTLLGWWASEQVRIGALTLPVIELGNRPAPTARPPAAVTLQPFQNKPIATTLPVTPAVMDGVAPWAVG